jgi:glycosyltransferase involved in cell wall biosynthesis
MAMSADNPKVSVCLMTYNGAATVERALTTLLAQTYRDYELIISDDHSTDDTLAICERIARGHRQVRFIRPERNLGAYHNTVFALDRARGKYYVWACQDDWWEPDFLAALVDLLERSPGAICAQGRVRRVSHDGAIVHEVALMGRNHPARQTRLQLAASILAIYDRERRSKVKNTIFRNSIFMHGVWDRAAFAAALKAHREIFTNERQILCQLALAGEFLYVDRVLFHKTYYRRILLRNRYPSSDSMVQRKADTNRWRELMETLAAIVRSPLVQRRMKPIAVPYIFVAYWLYTGLNVTETLTRRVVKRLVRTLHIIVPGPARAALKWFIQSLRFGTAPGKRG